MNELLLLFTSYEVSMNVKQGLLSLLFKITFIFFTLGSSSVQAQWNSNRGSGYTPGPGLQIPNQWGHYSQYDSRNRPVGPHAQGWDPFDPRKGFTPDPSRRRLIEDPGDTRCKEAIHQGLDEFVTVNTAYGNVVGTVVYLCDGPQVPERDRPISSRPDQRPQGSPSTYRPIRSFWKNVTTFLGIPYARPPTRENNLRFKVICIKYLLEVVIISV